MHCDSGGALVRASKRVACASYACFCASVLACLVCYEPHGAVRGTFGTDPIARRLVVDSTHLRTKRLLQGVTSWVQKRPPLGYGWSFQRLL